MVNLEKRALIVVDVQKGFDDNSYWGNRNNPDCEITARMAGNLGFDTWFVIDAMHTFDRMDSNGQSVTADEISRMSALNLDGEFAQVIHTSEAIRKLTLG